MISDFEGPTPQERFVQSVLYDYSEGDHEFEKELITSYITSVEEHLPELSRSFANSDTKGAILHSHDIKGSSSYIGCEAVRYLSGKIEAHCKADDLITAETFYPELKSEVIQVFKQLYDYMESWTDIDGTVDSRSILLDDETTSTTSPTSPTSTTTTTTLPTSPSTTTTLTDNENNNNNENNIDSTNKINGIENGHNNDEINNNKNNNNNNNINNNNSNNSNIKNNSNNIKDEEHRSKSPIPQKPIDKIATETVNNNKTTATTQQTNSNANNNNNIKQQLNNNNNNATLDKIQSN